MKNLSIKEWVGVGAGVAFVAYMFFGNVIYGVFTGQTADSGEAINQTANVNNSNTMTQPQTEPSNAGGVKTEDLVVGTGAEVKNGSQVGVNYVLKLADGTLIQDSKQVAVGQAFEFTAGAGQLIPGWEAGILGMKVGGKRIITIPPSLGYGSQQAGPIPPNSTLVFEIEVVSVK